MALVEGVKFEITCFKGEIRKLVHVEQSYRKKEFL
jgi:hypothetical protein